MGISFLPTPSHRVFHYEPRYWNEKEEKMKERYAKYGKEYEPNTPWEAKSADKAGSDAASASDNSVVQPMQGDAAAGEQKEAVNHLRDGYVPGVLIRNAYRDGLNNNRRKSQHTWLRTLIILVSLVLAFVAVYYFTQGINILLTSQ